VHERGAVRRHHQRPLPEAVWLRANWAYSFVLVGKGNAEFEATVLYHNNNGRWRISNRTGPCRTHAVPKKIYQPACETN
jgi:hypothetical protein